jgi:hypothetical protein
MIRAHAQSARSLLFESPAATRLPAPIVNLHQQAGAATTICQFHGFFFPHALSQIDTNR